MPWPTYSERLVVGTLEATWFTFVIPDGKRAVVKCVTFVNNTTESFLFIARAGAS